MFDILFDRHRAAGPRGGFLIGTIGFVVDLTRYHAAGGTKDPLHTGIEALDLGSELVIYLNPSVQTVEMDVLATARPWTAEFFDSAGVSLAVRSVASPGRKLLTFGAPSIARIDCTAVQNEAYIFEMRGR